MGAVFLTVIFAQFHYPQCLHAFGDVALVEGEVRPNTPISLALVNN